MNILNSFLLDCCPLATSLTDIPASSCPENLGQIQRYWFVRRGSVIWDIATPANNVPATITGNAATVVAGWTILFAAADDTHVVTSPLIGGDSVIEAGSVVSQGGGDNSTLSGSTLINGITPATGKARFDSLTGAQIAAIRLLICEAANMEVYMINQQGLIWGQRVGDLFTGFDCENVVIETMVNSGFGTRDNNTLTFQLPYDYDETKGSITPTDFNALTV
tara:strand:- start:11415 stop:12077 length:663 start_codon:yes stop_codon:yes gene_type:complete